MFNSDCKLQITIKNKSQMQYFVELLQSEIQYLSNEYFRLQPHVYSEFEALSRIFQTVRNSIKISDKPDREYKFSILKGDAYHLQKYVLRWKGSNITQTIVPQIDSKL